MRLIADVTAEIFKIKNCSVWNLFKYIQRKKSLGDGGDFSDELVHLHYFLEIFRNNFCAFLMSWGHIGLGLSARPCIRYQSIIFWALYLSVYRYGARYVCTPFLWMFVRASVKLRIHMHVCVCVCVYAQYQNTKINREGILIYGYVCVYAWYSNALKSFAARRMTYTQTRIWIPSFTLCIRLRTEKR